MCLSSLAQIMACILLGTKPLPAQFLIYHQLDTQEQFVQKLKIFFHLKMLSAK